MRDETVYNDYSDWLLEHEELINNLKNMDSPLYFRIENVLNVIAFLYDKLIDEPNFSEEEDNIFVTGFSYAKEQIDEIRKVLSDVYRQDILQLNVDAKKVNLLLNTIDFQNELLLQANYDQQGMQFLLDFEQDVLNKLNNKEVISDDMYDKLDRESEMIFKRMNLDYYPIETIFTEIADEFGLI